MQILKNNFSLPFKTFLLSSVFLLLLNPAFAQFPIPTQVQSIPETNQIIKLNNELLLFRIADKSLYKTDGINPAVLVKQFNTSGSFYQALIQDYAFCNGLLYFSLFEDNNNGNDLYELWRTDGTTGGTIKIDSATTPYYYFGNSITTLGNTLYYVGRDSIYAILPSQQRIGLIDCLTNTSQTAGNLFPYRNYLMYNTSGYNLMAWDTLTGLSTLVFPIFNFHNGGSVQHFQIRYYNDTCYVTHSDFDGRLYWIAPDLSYGRIDSTLWGIKYFGTVNDRMLFQAHRSADSLMQTDFYAYDLVQKTLTPINPGTIEFSLYNDISVYVNDTIAFFMAEDSIHGTELWKTDGTQGGTTFTVDLGLGSDDAHIHLTQPQSDPFPVITHSYLCDSFLYLSAHPYGFGMQSHFRVYDGSTFIAHQLLHWTEIPYNFVEMNGEVYFILQRNTLYYLYKFTCGLGTNIQGVQIPLLDVLLYPQPASNEISLRFTDETNEITKIEIYNTLGQTEKIIIKGNIPQPNQTINIDLVDFRPGLYFVKLNSKQGQIVKRFIKQ